MEIDLTNSFRHRRRHPGWAGESRIVSLVVWLRRIKMDTKYLQKIITSALYGLVILVLVFSVTGSALAQDPNPWFTVFPEQGVVEGWDWPIGEEILLTIDDPETPGTTPDYSQTGTVIWEYDSNWVWIDFANWYTTKPGDEITVSLLNGEMAQTHVVQNLTITGIDPYENIVSGTANEGQVVVLWSWEDPESRRIETDDSGNWSVDFDDIGFDLESGYHVRAEVWVDSNDTAVDWEVPVYYDIYTFDPQTGETRLITKNLREAGEYDPTWSKNGKLIAHDVVSNDTHGIYITDVRTGVSTPLIGAQDGGNDASWSPNGKWIAFDRRWHGRPNIYVVPAIGGTESLVRENAVSANWAPNGRRIAFQDDTDGSIRTIPFGGGSGDETFIVDYGELPAWSPDGDWIAYTRDGDIWKVPVDIHGVVQGEPIQLTSGPFYDGKPTWSTDSLTIIYDSGFGQDWDLWSIPATGGTPTWLNGAPVFGEYGAANARNSSTIAYASFSPNGQAPRLWVAAYTYDLPPGVFGEGSHPYHFEFEWSVPEIGTWSGQGGEIEMSNDAELQDGYVLLRGPMALRGINTSDGLSCEVVPVVNPDQSTRFLVGWLPEFGDISFSDAKAHFESITARAVWDEGMSTELESHMIIPLSWDDWFQYVCTFTEASPKMDLRVNYGDDWVESFYEAGHEVVITVTESDGETIKATAQVQTVPRGEWGGEEGFQTTPEDWIPAPPDIQPWDWVYAQVDSGVRAKVQIGDISGMVDFNTDSVVGSVLAPWFSVEDEVGIDCHSWGAPLPEEIIKNDWVLPDGVDTYSCAWNPESEWDIQPWQIVGVGYSGPDGHWVANTFWDERWTAVWNYDLPVGALLEGIHSYTFDIAYTIPEEVDYLHGAPREFTVTNSAPVYSGYALIDPWDYKPIQVWTGAACEVVSELNPEQPIRFISGWVNDYSMPFEDALAHFNSITVDLFWDEETVDSTSFIMSEMLPFYSRDERIGYICSFSEHE